MVDTLGLDWRKALPSMANAACVEVAAIDLSGVSWNLQASA